MLKPITLDALLKLIVFALVASASMFAAAAINSALASRASHDTIETREAP